MKYFYKITMCIVFLPFSALVTAQEVREDTTGNHENTKYASETFKSSRVILGQSVELPDNGNLVLLISHHFGAINTGYYHLFGIDVASTRVGLEYGINNWLGAGFGVNTYNLTWDAYGKAKLLRQSKGERKMPFSLSVFGNITINSMKPNNPEQKWTFDSRLAYCAEAIIARKFGKAFTFQLQPVYIHKNLVQTSEDHNDIYALGGGVSVRVSDVVSLNGEYYYLFPNQTAEYVQSSMSIGIDLLVGQHVFQLFFTNSPQILEESFITENNGKVLNGDIHFGFNIHRVFTVKKPKHKIPEIQENQ